MGRALGSAGPIARWRSRLIHILSVDDNDLAPLLLVATRVNYGRSPSGLAVVRSGLPADVLEPFLCHFCWDAQGERKWHLGVRERCRMYGGNANIVEADPAAGQDLGVKHLTPAEVRYAAQEEIAVTMTNLFAQRASQQRPYR